MQVRGALACIDHNSNRSRKQVNLPCCSVEDPVGSTTFSRIRIRKKLPCCRCWHICIYTVCTRSRSPIYWTALWCFLLYPVPYIQYFDVSYCSRYRTLYTVLWSFLLYPVPYIQYFDACYCLYCTVDLYKYFFYSGSQRRALPRSPLSARETGRLGFPETSWNPRMRRGNVTSSARFQRPSGQTANRPSSSLRMIIWKPARNDLRNHPKTTLSLGKGQDFKLPSTIFWKLM
jgi:hypothetical protein